jgi:phage host-nuclease inhibitor protein Gam
MTELTDYDKGYLEGKKSMQTEIERLQEKIVDYRELTKDATEAIAKERTVNASLRALVGELVEAGNFMHDAVENFTKESNWEMLRKWRVLTARAEEVLK